MNDAPFSYIGVVYPWQCDHMGHMNVMWYVSKFDEATWTFFASLGLTRSRLSENGIGMAALEQNIAYKRELLPGDVVEVRTRLVELKDKSMRFVHSMSNRNTGILAATCELLGICLDTKIRKATKLPDDVAALARTMLSNE